MAWRRWALAVIVFAVGACTEASTGAVPTSTTTTLPTTTATTTTVPPSDPQPAPPNPLTNRTIASSTLALMPLVNLPAPFGGFVAQPPIAETNAVAAQRAPERADEQADIDRYGRLDGYRTVHQAGALVAKTAVSVDTWIALFETDEGASGYLNDYADDVIKGLDLGHGGALRVVEGSDFVVDELGDEAVGLLAIEAAAGAVPFYETIVAFRVGRLIGFTSILRDQPGDVRILALRIAAELERRIGDALSGSIRSEGDRGPRALVAYTFGYEQVLTEEYLLVVYPEEPPTFGEDPPPEGEDPTTSTSTTTTTIAGTTTSSSSTSSTTTTTLLVPTTSISVVESSGFVAGSDLDCRLRLVGAASALDLHYLVVGDEVWRSTVLPGLGEDDEPETYEAVDPADEFVDSDLIYCPGWSPLLDESGLGTVITPGEGTADQLDGRPAERFDLDVPELEAIGILPPDSTGISVPKFTVWIGGEGPWVLAVDLALEGTTAAMDAALGGGFYPDADVRIEVRFEIGSLNDPRLAVVPPA